MRAPGTDPPSPGPRLRREAEEIDWYHSMELAPGLLTDGVFDLRPYVSNYELPERMDGMRAIDVGAFDGFWSFEMERRGAEVVALDLGDRADLAWPGFRDPSGDETQLGAGFRVARALLGSTVRRVERSIYEADASELGHFDLVFCGSMLIHLKNQLLALERMRELLRPGGKLISCEPYDRWIGLLPFPAARFRALRPGAPVFWEPGPRTWGLMIQASGFQATTRVGRFKMRSRRGYSVRHVVFHATRERETDRGSRRS
jgi:tRNA (mo5U34)-methyltransferase